MDALLEYWPTALVGLISVVIAQYVVRQGKREETAVQQAANRLSETQQALDARGRDLDRKDLELSQERTWRKESDETVRMLQAIVTGQIAVEAARVSLQIDPPSSDA